MGVDTQEELAKIAFSQYWSKETDHKCPYKLFYFFNVISSVVS